MLALYEGTAAKTGNDAKNGSDAERGSGAKKKSAEKGGEEREFVRLYLDAVLLSAQVKNISPFRRFPHAVQPSAGDAEGAVR